jgi:hypothetical protein
MCQHTRIPAPLHPPPSRTHTLTHHNKHLADEVDAFLTKRGAHSEHEATLQVRAAVHGARLCGGWHRRGGLLAAEQQPQPRATLCALRRLECVFAAWQLTHASPTATHTHTHSYTHTCMHTRTHASTRAGQDGVHAALGWHGGRTRRACAGHGRNKQGAWAARVCVLGRGGGAAAHRGGRGVRHGSGCQEH